MINHWHILCTFKSWNPAESILYDILFTCVQGLDGTNCLKVLNNDSMTHQKRRFIQLNYMIY